MVILPVTFVGCPIRVNVHSKAVCFVIPPLSFVDVTVDMDKLPSSVGLVVLPISFVPCTIWPHLDTIALSIVPLPFPVVYYPRLEGNRRSLFLCGCLVRCGGDILVDLALFVEVDFIVTGDTGTSE